MKKTIVSTKRLMIMAMMMAMTITANAMSYTAAKNEALFLSDKMAYELNLTDAQYDAVYEINLAYLMSVNGRNDLNGAWWDIIWVALSAVMVAALVHDARKEASHGKASL